MVPQEPSGRKNASHITEKGTIIDYAKKKKTKWETNLNSLNLFLPNFWPFAGTLVHKLPLRVIELAPSIAILKVYGSRGGGRLI